jgi:hypothetical protein
MSGDPRLFERYLQLRTVCMSHHKALQKRVPDVLMNRWAREFGMWEDDRIAVISAAEFFVLVDFCIYSAPYRGKTIMEAYLDGLQETTEPDDRVVREAIRNHRYCAFEVTRPRKGIGVEAVDFFRPDSYFIADVGFSLSLKKGRLIFNGFPTGVEVCPSMHHGGPYPATTDARLTSVGTAAIYRFTRPVCYQNFPQEALPAELRDRNERGIWRLINGELSKDDCGAALDRARPAHA